MEGKISKRFVIYEYTDGAADRPERLPPLGSIEYGPNGKGTIRFEYNGVADEDPAIECVVTVNPAMLGTSPDEREINQHVESGLHYGIYLSHGIVPLGENCEYVFYRHGKDITRWLKSQATR